MKKPNQAQQGAYDAVQQCADFVEAFGNDLQDMGIGHMPASAALHMVAARMRTSADESLRRALTDQSSS